MTRPAALLAAQCKQIEFFLEGPHLSGADWESLGLLRHATSVVDRYLADVDPHLARSVMAAMAWLDPEERSVLYHCVYTGHGAVVSLTQWADDHDKSRTTVRKRKGRGLARLAQLLWDDAGNPREVMERSLAWT